jgi:uncharacterized protein
VSEALGSVTDNQEASSFEARADGELAGELTYLLNGDRLALLHAGVLTKLEGRGIGGSLVAAAVDRAERDGLTLVPLCPFTRAWLRRNPAAAARVGIDWGGRRTAGAASA